jgi:MFS transporter, SHS family, lactate transporter
MSSRCATSSDRIAWWREPTRDNWMAWVAAWLAWTLDIFDFGIFLLIMVAVSRRFAVPLTSVTIVLSVTLWTRLLGSLIGGWVADRVGRKLPLMVSILGFALCNLGAGMSPTFMYLLLFRAIFGLFLGAEWAIGAALAMESWPARSRGLMSGVLTAGANVGILLASVAYGVLFRSIGWRGLLMLGVLPALLVVFVQFFVKEPRIWVENRKLQNRTGRHVSAPLFSIFRREMRGNTLTACWWMIGTFIMYYSITALFATHLQKDLKLDPAIVATPVAVANLVAVFAMAFWGFLSDRLGRRLSIIIPTAIAVLIAPIYLLSDRVNVIVVGYGLQGLFGLAIYGQNPSYLAERFPTEVRVTASAFVYNVGAFAAGFTPFILTMLASDYGIGLGISMLLATMFGAANLIVALLFGPETKGKALESRPVLT